jgi:hypothetical protein
LETYPAYPFSSRDYTRSRTVKRSMVNRTSLSSVLSRLLLLCSTSYAYSGWWRCAHITNTISTRTCSDLEIERVFVTSNDKPRIVAYRVDGVLFVDGALCGCLPPTKESDL